MSNEEDEDTRLGILLMELFQPDKHTATHSII